MSRLVVAADNHVGKGAHLFRTRLDEQEHVWAETLRLARDLDSAAVLHAGDLFDRRRPSPAEVVAVERPLVHHDAVGGCPVHVIPGNHDTTAHGPGGLHVLAEAGLIELWPRPAVIVVDGFEVVTLPWSPSSRLIAERGGRDGITDDVVELLVTAAGELLAETAGPFPILLGHWSAAGASLPNGLPVEQLREPVLPTDELEALGFAAIALGHIHVGAVLKSDAGRTFYTGSPMPLDHGEAGLIHGVWSLGDDEENGDVELVPGLFLRAHPLTSTPFVTVSLRDVELAPVDGAVVRVRDTIEADDVRAVNLADVRDRLLNRGAVRVDLEVTFERVSRPLVSAVDTDRQPIHLLADFLGERGIEPDRQERLLELADSYLAGERTPATKGES